MAKKILNDEHHFNQAQHNLRLLEQINQSQQFWDWQTTILFYSALHLVNGHIFRTTGTRYNSHSDVANIIHHLNPNPASLPKQFGIDYGKLQNLSRTARYLYDSESKEDRIVKSGQDNLVKAVYLYEKVCAVICPMHHVQLSSIQITCHRESWSPRLVPNLEEIIST